jgi:hypothetical protein
LAIQQATSNFLLSNSFEATGGLAESDAEFAVLQGFS